MGGNYIRNRSGSGTIAYQAPEVFVEGSKLTPAVDVYAFGKWAPAAVKQLARSGRHAAPAVQEQLHSSNARGLWSATSWGLGNTTRAAPAMVCSSERFGHGCNSFTPYCGLTQLLS